MANTKSVLVWLRLRVFLTEFPQPCASTSLSIQVTVAVINPRGLLGCETAKNTNIFEMRCSRSNPKPWPWPPPRPYQSSAILGPAWAHVLLPELEIIWFTRLKVCVTRYPQCPSPHMHFCRVFSHFFGGHGPKKAKNKYTQRGCPRHGLKNSSFSVMVHETFQ